MRSNNSINYLSIFCKMERKEHERTIILRRSYKLSVCGEEYKNERLFYPKEFWP